MVTPGLLFKATGLHLGSKPKQTPVIRLQQDERKDKVPLHSSCRPPCNSLLYLKELQEAWRRAFDKDM